jgi:metal-responsive CopG/Arc/MetJ family transcriptional regulator
MKKAKTTQIGIRLDDELLEAIDLCCEAFGIDRNTLIRGAIVTKVQDIQKEMDMEAIADFIAGIIGSKDFLDETGMETVPEDILEARKMRLEKLALKDLE